MLYFLVTLTFFLGAGMVLGSYFGVTKMPGMLLQRKLEARLEEVAMGPEPESAGDGQPTGLLKATEGGPLPSIDRFVGGTTRGSALRVRVHDAVEAVRRALDWRLRALRERI